MQQQWKIGDVVRLRSGGPGMTVIVTGDQPNGRRIVSCQWYSEATSKFETGSFHAEALDDAKRQL
jgi:uncharacterized protein YodC (DUF2158 family)